ncbi:MAG: YdcF family protein [Rhodospirillaceae bacterium]|nr:MAG: YdcF family protein [Rhodospirillaceae bacterium]
MSLYQIVKGLALLPASLILALTFAIVTGLRWPRFGFGVLCATTLAFYLLASPFSSDHLARAIATIPALPADANLTGAKAIVVLAAGTFGHGPEYRGIMLDHITLERLRYAAHLYRRTNLPILVSGGQVGGAAATLASAMKQALEEDFGVPVTWVEDRSTDTAENARFSGAILKDAGITSIVLVAHAIDMPRAFTLFSKMGLTVTPAPTCFPSTRSSFPQDLFPSMSALDQSWMSVYEVLASAWQAVAPAS